MTEAGVAGGTSTIHHLAPVQMTLRGLHVAESATSAGPTRLGAGSAIAERKLATVEFKGLRTL